ncbi:phosphopantetheine-binding protein [Streptomyces niveus]|uniref:phosphopantetheine-binding protein n=1 Tax=Streptomyces niveus TaxID=193462 RepID=UPI003686D321
MAALFAELLKRDRVGVHEDFFELGGHSLLATRLINRIKEEFQVELSLQIMFENPTAAELAEQFDAGRQPRTALRARPRTAS